MFERRLTWHRKLNKTELGQNHRLMQQSRSSALGQFGQAQTLTTARKGREIRHQNIQLHERGLTVQQPMGLAQRLFVNRAHRRANRDRKVRVSRLPTSRHPTRCRPKFGRGGVGPNGQVTAIAKAFIIVGLARHPIPLLAKLLSAGGVELMWHQESPG